MATQSATIGQTLASLTQLVARYAARPAQTIASITQSMTGKKANEAGTAAQTLASITQLVTGSARVGFYVDPDAARFLPLAAVPLNLAADVNLALQFNAGYARELYVGTGGTLIAQMKGDDAPQTYSNVPSGSTLSGQWILVKSTGNGTTASNIEARG